MRAELEAIVEELKRRRAEGETTLYMPDETLQALRAKVGEWGTAGALRSSSLTRAEPPASAQRAAAQPEPLPERQREPEAPASHEYLDQPRARPHEGDTSDNQSKQPAARSHDAEAERIMQSFSKSTAQEAAPAERSANGGPAPIPQPTEFELPSGSKQERWDWLRDRVLNCPVCNAHVKPGKKVVFGVGNLDAKIFFCGEAPGADEEVEGEPFVGKAGQLLTKIIGAMGLSRQDVYIGNIMNWRPELPTPTGNRPPTQEEMQFCLPYLRAQIAVVQPQVIVALGNTAISGLLGPDPSRKLGKIRGSWLDFEGTPLMPTYHPSYVLRYGNNTTKRAIWEDMLAVMRKVGLEPTEKQEGYFR